MNDKLPLAAEWLHVVRSPDLATFAGFFTSDAVLSASVVPGCLRGAEAIYAFFQATRTMYDTIAFVSEVHGGDMTYLEWQGVFRGQSVSGVTSLTRDTRGLISHLTVNHRPYGQVVAFSADLLPAIRWHLAIPAA